MLRRKFLSGISVLAGSGIFHAGSAHGNPSPKPDDRRYWLDTLLKIVHPVMSAMSENRLQELMPVEAHKSSHDRMKVTYLEALGRCMTGLAPWLELQEASGEEQRLQQKYIALSLRSISNAVDPTSKGFLNFTEGKQPLVDAAFLAHGLLRAQRNVWANLGRDTQAHVINALKSTRIIKPYYSNWLLFSAMVEAALLKFAGDYDPMRVDYAVKEHLQWYKGDGIYGDGPDFHFDYYNSFVIQPMLLDVLKIVGEERNEYQDDYNEVKRRAQRYAVIQERMIAPDGSFPPVGRSLAYRCGAFQLLSQIALERQLPSGITPGAVRSALTAVIRRTMDAPGTFHAKGWLNIGLAGHQPGVGEHYISTGSLYLCTAAFLPLGLPPTDLFWTSPTEPWTSVKAFSGQDFLIDKSLSHEK